VTHTDNQLDVTLIAGPGRPPAGEGDLGSMLTAALDGLIEICNAHRGMIVLCNAEGEMLLGRARGRGREDLELSELADRPILDQVREQGVICWESHALAHPVVLGLSSARGLQPLALGPIALQAAELGPLDAGDGRGLAGAHKTCGLVYLDRGEQGAPFSRETLQLVEWLAQLVSVAVTRRLGRWRWRFLDVTKHYTP